MYEIFNYLNGNLKKQIHYSSDSESDQEEEHQHEIQMEKTLHVNLDQMVIGEYVPLPLKHNSHLDEFTSEDIVSLDLNEKGIEQDPFNKTFQNFIFNLNQSEKGFGIIIATMVVILILNRN